MKAQLTLALIASFIIPLAHADRVDNRQMRQRARIHEGVKSGELTRGEAAGLRSGERHVRRLERRAESDGQVTTGEAARLEKAQDRLSDRIHEQKHDEEKRN